MIAVGNVMWPSTLAGTGHARPIALTVEAGEGSLVLTWVDPARADVDSVAVYRSLTGEGDWVLQDTVNLGVETWEDQSAEVDTPYYYIVWSRNDVPAELTRSRIAVGVLPA